MSDNIDDSDDFDIYADLDCIFDTDTDVDTTDPNTDSETKSKKRKRLEEFASELIESDIEYPINPNNNRKPIECIDTNSETKCGENDLILSELTILEKSLNQTEDKNRSLEKQTEQLRQQLAAKDKQMLVLKTNISSLYKTAKQEIERKKTEINGLREELDSIIFRRLAQKRVETVPKPRKGIVIDLVDESPLSSDKSVDTSDLDFRLNSVDYNQKRNNRSVESPNERFRHRSTRKSRSRSRSRSESRNRDRNRHRISGETHSKSCSKRMVEDSLRTSGSKSRNDTKRHKCDKHSNNR